MDQLTKLSETIRVADVLDVLLVSVFAYAAISWFRRARSRFVLIGLAAVVGLYFVARLLDMYLTLFLFQVGVTVALIALVVIFQEDIRRAFERLGAQRLRGARVPSVSQAVVDCVVETAAALARQKTGALIVFKGKEPLTRHVTGGVELDGRVSRPLLASIFDDSSPGHDGAILIENGVVTRFAVHLPLSTRATEYGNMGTRHTAALGLAERSDAFVIVVSEERGVISTAHAAALEEAPSASELERRLLAFLAEVAPEQTDTWFRRLFSRDLWAKVLSLALAIAAWLILFGRQSEVTARTFDVPVRYHNVPEGWILEEPEPVEVRLTLEGSDRAFRQVDESTLSFSVGLDSLTPGENRIPIAEDAIDLPDNLAIHRIEPRSVTLVAHKSVKLGLEVEPTTVGRVPARFKLESLAATPERVMVRVPKKATHRYNKIHTEPVNLSSIETTTTLTRSLVVPKGARLAEDSPSEVDVRVVVSERVKEPKTLDGGKPAQ